MSQTSRDVNSSCLWNTVCDDQKGYGREIQVSSEDTNQQKEGGPKGRPSLRIPATTGSRAALTFVL